MRSICRCGRDLSHNMVRSMRSARMYILKRKELLIGIHGASIVIMIYKILHSKIEIPKIQKNLVIRERLLKIMSNSKEKMLVLNGALGYGKTVLLSHYIRLYKVPCAWYHLDEMDNDLCTFFEYLTEAFSGVWQDFKFDVHSYLMSQNETSKFYQIGMDFIQKLNEYLNRPQSDGSRAALVLDDFQTIRNEDIFSFIHLLMDHTSDNLKIYIAAKGSLPAFTATLVLQEKARILETPLLAFTEEEVVKVLEKATHFNIDMQISKSVFKKTEGWPVGTMFVAQYFKQNGYVQPNLDWDTISDKPQHHKKEGEERTEIHVQCFGTFTVYLGEKKQEMNWRTKKATELFAYLYVCRGKAVKRNDLLKILWPDEYPNNAVAMLHNMLYNIRKELAPFGIQNLIEYTGHKYTMDVTLISSDYDKVQQICQAVERKNITLLEENKTLFFTYWGTYLDGIENTWCFREKYYYEKCFINGCDLLSTYLMKNGSWDDAVKVLQAGIEMDVYAENLAIKLMKCYTGSHDKKEGRRLYEHISGVYRSDLHIDPSQEFVQAYEKCMNNV